MAFTDLASVFTWAELPGPISEAATPAGSLAALMGAQPTSHWRELSAIPEATFQAALGTWTINGTAATMW